MTALRRTSPPIEYMTDLLTAAAELGYGVVAFDGRTVTLASNKTKITIDSVFVSGAELRRILRAPAEAEA